MNEPIHSIELTHAEAKVFLVLLEQAKQEFSNHGCNEFHVVRDANLPEKAAGEVRDRMAQAGVIELEQVEVGGPYLQDWLLFAYLQEKVRRALVGTS
jgi:hypothetical protein